MKSTLSQLSFFALLVSGLASSCGAGELNAKAEKAADSFFIALQKKDYPAALNFCSNEAFTKNTKDDWRKAFERNAILLGDIQSFTRTSSFNIAASTSTGTSVAVAYDVQWQHGRSRDSVIFIKEKDGSMKIFKYQWLHKDAEYITMAGESEKAAAQYMDAVEANHYDAAVALCSDDALKITPKEQWITFLKNADLKLGVISNYTVLKESSGYNIHADGETGIGNYYDIYVRTTRGDHTVMEKLIFFQKDYSEPVKLVGHVFK